MSTGLSNLIFSERISESVKLELITKVLEKISPEMVVEHLFSHSTGKDDYVYVLENIPRVGVFRDIKKAFWKKINTLDEALIFEVTTQYIEKHAGNALPHEIKLVKEREKVNKKTAKMSKDSAPVGLSAIDKVYKDYDNARAEAKSARLQRAKERAQRLVSKPISPEYSKGVGDEKTEETRKAVFNKLNPQQKKEAVMKDIKDTTTAIKNGEKIKPKGFSDLSKDISNKLEKENNIEKNSPKQLSLKDSKPEVKKEEKTPSKTLFDQEIDKQLAKKEENKPKEVTSEVTTSSTEQGKPAGKPRKPKQEGTSTTNEPQATGADAEEGKNKPKRSGRKRSQTVATQPNSETQTSKEENNKDYADEIRQATLRLKQLKLSKSPLDQVQAAQDTLDNLKRLAKENSTVKKTKKKTKKKTGSK